MAKTMKVMENGCGPKCLFLMLLAALLGAGGLWMIVTGILHQMAPRAPWGGIVLWYTGGFILWVLAKQCKWKACPMCAMR